MEIQKETIMDKVNNIRNSITLKLFSIGILILLLLIPSTMIRSLISEREQNKDSAIREVRQKWGDTQTVAGPVLTVPYKTYYKKNEGEIASAVHYAHFLPENLDISGSIKPEKRNRGIYEIVLYNTQFEVKGNFIKPNFDEWKVSDENILWEDAFLSIGIPDMSGIQNNVQLNWQGKTINFEAGIPVHEVLSSGVSAKSPITTDSIGKGIDFAFSINLNGSKSLNFVPLGKKTVVKFDSEWTNPKFWGQFLPDNHNIDNKGFNATWTVLDLNRNYPQQWKGNAQDIYSSTFGVELLLPVDEYQKNMRSAKYASLIISLTFLIFFFVEVLNKKKIHPFQYILVGLALSLFYVLLLSITEHFGFNMAYIVSAAMVVALIAGYASAILKNIKITLVLLGFLILIYTFLFIILQLQDFSLLVGSLGLFMVLATAMYLSRKIDWYNINKPSKPITN